MKASKHQQNAQSKAQSKARESSKAREQSKARESSKARELSKAREQSRAREGGRYELLFNNYLVHLLEVLREAFGDDMDSELEHCYLKYHKYATTGRSDEFLQHLLSRFDPHIKLIAEQDEFLFSPDYHHGELRLLSGLNLLEIWKRIEQTHEIKKIQELRKEIWAGLTNLYISASLALGQTEKENPWPRRIMKNIRLQQQIDRELEEEPDDDSQEEGFNPMLPDISQIESIFNADNPLAMVLNDMKDDLNPETFLQTLNPDGKQNPLEILTNLFSADNQKGLQNIVQTLGDKFEEKMKARGFDEKDMEAATVDMQEKFAAIPGMGMINDLLKQTGGDAEGPRVGPSVVPSMQQACEAVGGLGGEGLGVAGLAGAGAFGAQFEQVLQQDPQFAAQLEQMKAGFSQFVQTIQDQQPHLTDLTDQTDLTDLTDQQAYAPEGDTSTVNQVGENE